MHSYNQLWKSSIKANSNSINKRKVFLYVNTLFSHIFFPRKSTCQKMPNIRPSSHQDWDGRRVGEQTNKRTDRRTGEHLSIYRSMDGQTNDKTNRRTEEQTTRQRHAQTDEQTNRRVNPSVRISFPAFEPIHAYINLTRSKGTRDVFISTHSPSVLAVPHNTSHSTSAQGQSIGKRGNTLFQEES